MSDASVDEPDASVPFNLAFTTSSTIVPKSLGGLAGADAECQAHAEAKGFEGTFVAYLADSSTDPADRVAGARGWVRTDGRPFADRPEDLGGHVFYPPGVDETGTVVAESERLMTGTTAVGTRFAGQMCEDWTSDVGSYSGGRPQRGGFSWHFFVTGSCASGGHLVCLQNDHNTPITFPEPSRMAFRTSGDWTPGAGIASADALCASEAVNAGLAGTFRALLAEDGGAALARFRDGEVWARRDGVPLADSIAGFAAGKVLADLAQDSDGRVTSANQSFAWTGAVSPGAPGDSLSTCGNWLSTGGTGIIGQAHATGVEFFNRSTATCDQTYRLYCLRD